MAAFRSEGRPMVQAAKTEIWLASGVRTPFAKVDGPLSGEDAIALSVPVAKHMIGQLKGDKPDLLCGGTWSRISPGAISPAKS